MRLKKLANLPPDAYLLLTESDERGSWRSPVSLVSVEGRSARVTSGRIRSENPDGSITVDPDRLTRDKRTERLLAASRREAADVAAFFRDCRSEKG